MKGIVTPIVFVFAVLCLSTQSGFGQNVGIGTTSPQAKLHIVPDSAAALSIAAFGSAAGQTGQLRFFELPGTGNNYVALKSPDNVGANVILVLPPNAGSNGQVLSTDGSGNLQWVNPPTGSGGGNSHCFTCDGF
jgi:hypothetical protein